MANIDINQLKPGMVIVQITAQNGPVKIRKSGLVSSQEMVLGLMEMGVQRLEIDPAQTVELDSPQPSSSPMQSLLMQTQQGKQNSVDNSMSEQFNRSLFLPSIAALPSVWQYYGQRTLMVLIVLAGGAGLGWTAATVDKWSSMFAVSHVPPAALVAPQSPAPSVKDQQPAPALATEPQSTQSEQDMSVAVQSPTGNIPPAKPEPKAQQISPELLEKFSQAVAEVGSTKIAEDPAIPEPEKVDVPRIDQLPAWVLKELPAMSFSAHMYASEPQERWVTLNGAEIHEGEWINQNLQLERITPQQVILNYKGQQFSMNALTDW
ncbi:general secretion pathway protein GspB [Neptunicella sp.]|uniref:general secretion pathway protein GspB n=1 Tax=Neptunicella sp. TaxID=2125986 RepID=UPI003F68E14F